MSMSLVENLPPTSLQFNQHEPSFTVTSGAETMKLFKHAKSRLINVDKPLLGQGTPEVDKHQLVVKLTSAVLLEVGQYYLDKPSDESRQAVMEVHEAFGDLLRENPREAVNAALQTGTNMLKQALNHPNLSVSVGGELDLLPCTAKLVDFEVKDDGEQPIRKGIDIVCGSSHVVLVAFSDGVGPIDQEGDADGMEMRNIRATFIALNVPIRLYLEQAKDTEGELKVPAEAVLAGIDAWEEVKVNDPEMVKDLLPRIESGQVMMQVIVNEKDDDEDGQD